MKIKCNKCKKTFEDEDKEGLFEQMKDHLDDEHRKAVYKEIVNLEDIIWDNQIDGYIEDFCIITE